MASPWKRSIASCLALTLYLIPVAGQSDDGSAAVASRDLVRTANAPISDILQFRLQDVYIPDFHGLDGDSNTLTLSITAPLPKYRLIPFPQLSLLTIPTVTSVPGD